MNKLILSLMCLFFVVFSGISYAITINTAQIKGTYYGLTGALNNPAVGIAVNLGTAVLTKATPWVTGIGLALSVYKIAEELYPGQVVAFRPGLVSESVPTWTNNLPPSTTSPIVSTTNGVWNVSGKPETNSSSATAACQAVTSYNQSLLPVAQLYSQNYWVCKYTVAPYQNVWADAVSPTCPGGTGSFDASSNYSCNTNSCPSGYTLSGSSCNLSNSSLVKYPSDGISTYVSDGAGHFVLDPRDPDLPASNLSGIAGQSSVTQKSADGKQSSTTTQNTDGSISHSTTNEYYDSTDASTHQFTQNFTINNAGAVTSYSTSNPAVNVINGVSTPSSTPLTVTFPSDYARVGEAQSAANSTNLKLDTLHNDLTNTSTPATDPTPPPDSGYKDFGTTFNNLTGWTLPGHTSTCPTPTFSVPWGSTYTISAHCDLINAHWSVLQTAMTVVWTIAALFIVLGA